MALAINPKILGIDGGNIGTECTVQNYAKTDFSGPWTGGS